jgi:tetratricopeptide (TPR) repeat protein
MMQLGSVSSVLRTSICVLALFTTTLVLQAQSLIPARSSGEASRSTQPDTTATEQKIQRQIAQIYLREKADASVHELGLSWALIGAEYSNTGNLPKAEDAYNHALKLVSAETSEAELYADILDQVGALYRIYGRFDDAMRCYRSALTLRLPFGDPLQDARSRARLAELALIARKYKEAYAETDQAYQSMIRMHDPDSSEVVSALIVRAYAQCAMHQSRKAEQSATEALARSRADFPETSMPVAASMVVLGAAQLKNGEMPQAEESLQHATDLLKAQLAGSDPRLVYAMTQYHETLLALHRQQDAQRIQNELEAIALRPQPACVNCTVSAFGLRSPGMVERPASPTNAVRSTSEAAAWMPAGLAPQAP